MVFHQSNIKKQLTCYFLLLCLSVTIVPFNQLLHHHDNDVYCDLSDETLENDPCHIASHHSSNVEKPHCEHKAHFEKAHAFCEVCKIVIPDRHIYVKNIYYPSFTLSFTKTLAIFDKSFFYDSYSKKNANRGPPVVA